jgi:uncharacterized protein (DUF305 family)
MKTHTAGLLFVAGGGRATALALPAWGGQDDGGMDQDMPGMSHGSGSAAANAAFTDADVRFATDMIVHHQQAIVMAQAAFTRAGDAKVKELATKIAAAQSPEINTMSGWLTRWGKPLPSEPAMPGMDHGSMPGTGHSSGMPGMDHGSMPGLMSDQEMADLMAATGPAFDKLFLQLMIKHHQGAIEMAGTEQRQGKDAAARELAAKIAADQATEVTQMQDLLKPLS